MTHHTDLIDWLDAKLRTWGYDRRRLRQSRYPQSAAARFDEPIGYGVQREPMEGLKGDALLVSVAIQRALEQHQLSLKQHAVLYLHYDDRYRKTPAKAKCEQLGVKRERYYQLLRAAHRKLDAHWPTDMDRGAEWVEGGYNRAVAAGEWPPKVA